MTRILIRRSGACQQTMVWQQYPIPEHGTPFWVAIQISQSFASCFYLQQGKKQSIQYLECLCIARRGSSSRVHEVRVHVCVYMQLLCCMTPHGDIVQVCSPRCGKLWAVHIQRLHAQQGCLHLSPDPQRDSRRRGGSPNLAACLVQGTTAFA